MLNINRQKSFLIIIILIIIYSFYYLQKNDVLVRSVSYIIPKSKTNDQYNVWRHMGDSILRHQMYSAYFDPRIEIIRGINDDAFGSVRVFAILPLELTSEMYCVFNIRNDTSVTTTIRSKAGEAVAIHEHFNEPFSAYTIMCPVKSHDNSFAYLPTSVGLSYADNPTTLLLPTMIPISYPSDAIRKSSSKFLAACVGPLENNYNHVLRLVEFIELNRLLGVEKFYFYNHNTTESILKILNYYREQNIAEIFDWKLSGYMFEKELRYFGILAEINECVYRATFIDGFEYVAVLDIDENLMPIHTTFKELLKKYDDSSTSSFIFRHVLFAPDKNLYSNFYIPPNVKNRHLQTQIKTFRYKSPLPRGIRSKYIVKGRTVIEMGNHKVWRSIRGYSYKTISTDDGLLFHYRSKPCGNCLEGGLVADYTALKFGSLIWNNVEAVCKINFSDGLCPGQIENATDIEIRKS